MFMPEVLATEVVAGASLVVQPCERPAGVAEGAGMMRKLKGEFIVMLPWRKYTMAHMGVWVPWHLRMWAGLAGLLDAVILLGTVGLVSSSFAADAYFAILGEGLRREEREEER